MEAFQGARVHHFSTEHIAKPIDVRSREALEKYTKRTSLEI